MTQLTEGDLLLGIMKLTPSIKIHNSTTNKTLYWADREKQWEVYSFDRRPIWHYKGDNLFVALESLNGETK